MTRLLRTCLSGGIYNEVVSAVVMSAPSCTISPLLDQGLLRGTIVTKTYGAHKNLHISLFLSTIFGPINNGPP